MCGPLRVTYPLSLLSLNLAVVTRYPTTLYLRVLGIQARLDLIAVHNHCLFALFANITKFYPFNLYQPSVVVDYTFAFRATLTWYTVS